MFTRRSIVISGMIVVLLGNVPAQVQERSIIVASTTSTEDSGLFGHILPLFKAKTGIDARVVAQGTGQRSIQAAAGMRTCFSYTPKRKRKSSCLKATARSGIL